MLQCTLLQDNREGGTVPAISFKSDILAAKVNITNMDNEAFFNILDIPFEL